MAEGIETDVMLNEVRSLGCGQIQGNLLSLPMEADQFEIWFRERKTARAAQNQPVP